METIDLLQEVIADYDGTVLIVSHDRDFLDRTVTGLLAFEENGKIIPHAGGYSDYLARRRQTGDKQTAKDGKGKSGKPKQDKTDKSRDRAVKDRLSYKQVYLLEQLPKEIDALRGRIETGEARLADMDFFQSDPAGYEKLAKQVAADKQAIDSKEENWLELEILRENITAD